MNLHDLPATLPTEAPKLLTGSHGDHLTDVVVSLVEFCWASGLSARVAATRTHADFHWVRQIYAKCDRLLVERSQAIKQEMLHE